jgi:hypothetical protein
MSGNLWVDILVPNNEESNPSKVSFPITGTLTGTATLVNTSAWFSGMLDSYLGISANPANPIGAYLPSTQALDPGATGCYVYQVDLGTTMLQSPKNPNKSPLENVSGTLPLASYIVGFLNEGTSSAPSCQATANSGAIFAKVPELASLVLLGTSLLGAPSPRFLRKWAPFSSTASAPRGGHAAEPRAPFPEASL